MSVDEQFRPSLDALAARLRDAVTDQLNSTIAELTAEAERRASALAEQQRIAAERQIADLRTALDRQKSEAARQIAAKTAELHDETKQRLAQANAAHAAALDKHA